MDMTHPLAQHYDRYSFTATASFVTYTCSSDYEIMQLPNTGGTLCVPDNTQVQGIATAFEGKVFNPNLLIRHKGSQ